MEAPVIAAISVAVGAICGAGIAALFNFRAHRESLRQRTIEHRESLAQGRREHLVSLAYEAATAEWKHGLEFAQKSYSDGNFIGASYSTYLVYHLALAQMLVDRKDIETLDKESLTRALDKAHGLALTSWNHDPLAGEAKG